MAAAMELEMWRPVEGWPGYEVSSIGRVRSLTRKGVRGQNIQGRTLKASLGTGKYRVVTLYGDGIKHREFVHVLVLEAFSGNRPEGYVTRHLDGDSLNNVLENLRWGTVSENVRDSIDHGVWSTSNRVECPKGHLLVESNLVEWHAARGRRTCKTCREARNRARYTRDENGKFPPRRYAERRYSKPRGPELNAAEIANKYVQGASFPSLVREYRTSGPRIRECLLSQGVSVRPRGGYHRNVNAGGAA